MATAGRSERPPGRWRVLLRIAGLLLVLLAAIAVTSVPLAAQTSRRMALVVGNSGYQHAEPLRNARSDASAMAEKLRDLGFQVALALDAGKAAFEDRVNAFARGLTGADAAVFYYAGHGLQVDGRNFMVPVDATASNEADLPFELVALDIVLNRLASHRITNIVVIDACRDNPLGERLSKALGERSTAVGKGLASVGANVGTLISFSTQPGHYALDGAGNHSPFTGALLTHIKTPDLDVLEVMKRVRRDVVASTLTQVPWDNSSLIDAFYFSGSDGQRTRPADREVTKQPAEPGKVKDRAQSDLDQDLALVLPPDGRPVLSGRPPLHECDRVAASATDPERLVDGATFGALDGTAGVLACRKAVARYPNTPRFEFQLARSLHKAEHYAEAARLYRGLVERGYLAAFTNYGWLLDFGQGVAKDHVSAIRLHLLAAHQGDQFGMFNAAMSYDSGNGLPYDPKQAAHWIYAALRLGHEYSIKQMSGDAAGWTPEFRKELQRLLRRAKLYAGPIDGVFRANLHQAARELQHLPLAPTPGGAVPTQRFDPKTIPINSPAGRR